MVPTAFDEENLVLHPPPGADLDQVQVISVFKGELENGTPCVVSCWKVTDAELAEIKRTRRVWVVVRGHRMAPISVTGLAPWTPEAPDGPR